MKERKEEVLERRAKSVVKFKTLITKNQNFRFRIQGLGVRIYVEKAECLRGALAPLLKLFPPLLKRRGGLRG